MKVIVKKKGLKAVVINPINKNIRDVHFVVKVGMSIQVDVVHEILKYGRRNYKCHFLAEALPIKNEGRIFEHI